MASQKKIFVQIASYRDPECQRTVKDLFEKAKHPERVFVGICWQYDMKEGTEKHLFKIPYPYPDNVRIVEYDHRDARGANWARDKAAALIKDEDYIFFSEPHCRYVQGWDEKLITMLGKCPSKKPILSSLMPPYVLPDELGGPFVNNLHTKCFHTNDISLVGGEAQPNDAILEIPFPSSILVVNCLFADAKLIKEVPQDPYIYFEGDETSYSARTWTHGWDIFCMNEVISYHMWDRSRRPMHLHHQPKSGGELNERSAERFKYLFGMEETASPEALKEIEKYGFGNVRSLKEYEEYAGVDFKNRIVHDQSRWYIKRDENNLRPVAPAMQQWIMHDNYDWIKERLADGANEDALIDSCVENGIERKFAVQEFAKMKDLFERVDAIVEMLKTQERLPQDPEEWSQKYLAEGKLPEELFLDLCRSGWDPLLTATSLLYAIYTLPYMLAGIYIDKEKTAARFLEFIKNSSPVLSFP